MFLSPLSPCEAVVVGPERSHGQLLLPWVVLLLAALELKKAIILRHYFVGNVVFSYRRSCGNVHGGPWFHVGLLLAPLHDGVVVGGPEALVVVLVGPERLGNKQKRFFHILKSLSAIALTLPRPRCTHTAGPPCRTCVRQEGRPWRIIHKGNFGCYLLLFTKFFGLVSPRVGVHLGTVIVIVGGAIHRAVAHDYDPGPLGPVFRTGCFLRKVHILI